ncbi:PrsW family intramembrane metalloprotease [Streptomyces sp. B6B3]|uniref:PrsW family intramembrane metalloprotease n=1 Tax=Streptomyces sp. B6B3 TaxID=3153570 RepID=UPI00325DE812
MRPHVPPHGARRRLYATAGIGVPLALCGLLVFALVWRETGGDGFWLGLALAALPVPFLVGVFRWMDGVSPKPWRQLTFAFAWGACAATLVALVVNGLLVQLLTGEQALLAPARSAPLSSLELTVIAPVVEEAAKATAVLLLFLHRPHAFDGVLAGIATAGITATGFAFTENVLYLGSAVNQDRLTAAGTPGDGAGVDTATLGTFFVRVLLAPFAHPVFTALTGVGLGVAAALARRRRVWRAVLPPLGLAAAMGLHSAWNASTSLPFLGFAAVYVLLMMPVFGLLCWLAIWTRQGELRAARDTLPQYARAGWFGAAEPAALGSTRVRALARRQARKDHGWAGVRAVAGYQSAATSLAVLRRRVERHGTADPDFPAREHALLTRLWLLRPVAAPALATAAAQAAALTATTAHDWDDPDEVDEADEATDGTDEGAREPDRSGDRTDSAA